MSEYTQIVAGHEPIEIACDQCQKTQKVYEYYESWEGDEICPTCFEPKRDELHECEDCSKLIPLDEKLCASCEELRSPLDQEDQDGWDDNIQRLNE